MRKKAIVFDLDGTILNTTGDIAMALGKTLSTEITGEQSDRFIGNGLRNALKAAAEETGYRYNDLDELLEKLLFHYRETPVKYTKPYPGVEALLADLKAADIPMCVYSNKEQDLTETVLEICFPDIKFAQITGMHGKYERKPSSQAIIEFSKLVKVPLDEILYVGDSDVDFRTAVNAGLEYRILTWGTRKKEDLLEAGVPKEVLISDIDQIRHLVL